MGWPSVIVFAICAGVYTGVVAFLPVTEGTSFRDIAVTFEWWVIFAFVIASNCEKSWEAALKIFVFFLISQPIVYAVQVLAGTLDASLAWLYYTSIWGPRTLLTLPGGFVAFYIKKQNALGAVVLGLGCAIQAFMGLAYFITMLNTPPAHLLTVLVCFASIFVMVFQIQKSARNRLIALSVAAAAVVLVVLFVFLSGRVIV